MNYSVQGLLSMSVPYWFELNHTLAQKVFFEILSGYLHYKIKSQRATRLSFLPVNMAVNQTGTGLWDWWRPVWQQGTPMGRMNSGTTGTAGNDRRKVKQQRSKLASAIGSSQKWPAEPGYFHILLCGLRIYFDQSRGDCGKTNQDCLHLN